MSYRYPSLERERLESSPLSEDGSLIEGRPDSLVDLARRDGVFEMGWVDLRKEESEDWGDHGFVSVADGESKSVEREDWRVKSRGGRRDEPREGDGGLEFASFWERGIL